MKKQNWSYDIETYPNMFCVTFKVVGKPIYRQFLCYMETNELMDMIAFVNEEVNYTIGYYSKKYDNLVMNFIYKHIDKLRKGWNGYVNTACTEINLISYKINQEMQNLFDASDQVKNLLYGNWFKNIDLFNLVRVGKSGKSLKMCGILLRHHKIQDLPYYFLDKLVASQVREVLKYNINDVDITELLYFYLEKQIKDRIAVGEKYKVDVIDSSNADVGFKIISKLYAEETGIPFSVFKHYRTVRNIIDFADIISKKIQFSTAVLQAFLDKMMHTHTYAGNKFEYHLKYNNITFTIGEGGLHTQDGPAYYKQTDTTLIKDADVNIAS